MLDSKCFFSIYIKLIWQLHFVHLCMTKYSRGINDCKFRAGCLMKKAYKKACFWSPGWANAHRDVGPCICVYWSLNQNSSSELDYWQRAAPLWFWWMDAALIHTLHVYCGIRSRGNEGVNPPSMFEMFLYPYFLTKLLAIYVISLSWDS